MTVAAVAEPKSVDAVLRLYHGIMQIVRGGGVTAVTQASCSFAAIIVISLILTENEGRKYHVCYGM